MAHLLHLDGYTLIGAGLLLAIIGLKYHRWRFRVPVFALVFFQMALGIVMLGVYHQPAPVWIYLRLGADMILVVLFLLYLHARRGHPP